MLTFILLVILAGIGFYLYHQHGNLSTLKADLSVDLAILKADVAKLKTKAKL